MWIHPEHMAASVLSVLDLRAEIVCQIHRFTVQIESASARILRADKANHPLEKFIVYAFYLDGVSSYSFDHTISYPFVMSICRTCQYIICLIQEKYAFQAIHKINYTNSNIQITTVNNSFPLEISGKLC